MSESQSVTVKPRFELVLGAILLIIVLAQTMIASRSEKPGSASTDRSDGPETPAVRAAMTEQIDPTTDTKIIENEEAVVANALDPVIAGVTQDLTDLPVGQRLPTLKLVRIFRLSDTRQTGAPDLSSHKAELILSEVDWDALMGEPNYRARPETEHLDLMCTFTIENRPKRTGSSDAAPGNQAQYGPSIIVNGNLVGGESSTADLVMSLYIVPTRSDVPPAVNTARVRLAETDVITNSQPALILVHSFPLDEVADSEEASPTDLDDRGADGQFFQTWNREPFPELLQTFYFEDQIDAGTLYSIPASCQGQRLTFSGTVKVWKEKRVYVVLSLTVFLSTGEAAQDSR